MSYYKVLGVANTATKPEIKEAFRKLALKYHPDKHSHSPQPVRDDALRRFNQASQAYQVLVDDRQRAQYDRQRANLGRRKGGITHDDYADAVRRAGGGGAKESHTHTYVYWKSGSGATGHWHYKSSSGNGNFTYEVHTSSFVGLVVLGAKLLSKWLLKKFVEKLPGRK